MIAWVCHFIYPAIHWWAPGLFLPSGYCEQNHSEHFRRSHQTFTFYIPPSNAQGCLPVPSHPHLHLLSSLLSVQWGAVVPHYGPSSFWKNISQLQLCFSQTPAACSLWLISTPSPSISSPRPLPATPHLPHPHPPHLSTAFYFSLSLSFSPFRYVLSR